GRASTTVDPLNADEHEANQHDRDKMISAVQDALHEAITSGRDAYEHKTSEETARDWCENNEVQEYEEDGTLV
ncbi:MAG TPA: hypothetical protein VFL72_05725, partial [Acidimicrobiia bacterium]|nr:hypothetical protein [Acidimicrobiia bacterium]